MTAICGGGSSSPKIGVSGLVSLSSQAIIQLLVGNKYKWLTFAASWLPIDLIDVNTFCATDPPSQPTFTANEVNAMLQLNVLSSDWASGLSKLGDLVRLYAWYTFCQCDNITTLTPPAAQTQPTGSGTVLQSNYQRCTAANVRSNVVGAAVNTWQKQFNDLFTQAPWSYTDTPKEVELMMYSGTFGSTVHGTFDYRFRFFSDPSAAVEISDDIFQLPSGAEVSTFLTVPEGAVGLSAYTRHSVSGIQDNPNVRMWLMCGSDTTGVTPCCPPDNTIATVLKRIEDLVTLIQRQAAPFGYVPGASHAGLTGTGQISVSDLLGVAIEITTQPSSYGVSAGHPDMVFNLGFVTFGTADGWEDSRRIDHDGKILLPLAAGLYTLVGYTLRPGVEITLTELLREP